MTMQTGEIQPIVADSWTLSDTGRRESQTVPPVVKAEGSAAEKVKSDTQGSDASDAQAKSQYLAQAVEKMQSYLQETLNVSLDFQIDDKTNEVIVRVCDKATGEVIRQIPAEDVVRLREQLEEYRGALFDDKV